MKHTMSAGTTVGIKFTYWDDEISFHGSWVVPHDSQHQALDSLGESIGYTILYEISKQPSRTVSKVEIIDWGRKEDYGYPKEAGC